MNVEDVKDEGAVAIPPVTVSHLLGEMVWLLSQSPLYRELKIGDLEWLIMPPLIHRQFYIFRDGDKPVGLALWAKCDAEAEAKLENDMVSENKLNLAEWNSGENTWLVELIAPFNNEENQHRNWMIADLISGPLANTLIKFHEVDPDAGSKSVRIIEAKSGEKLRNLMESSITS